MERYQRSILVKVGNNMFDLEQLFELVNSKEVTNAYHRGPKERAFKPYKYIRTVPKRNEGDSGYTVSLALDYYNPQLVELKLLDTNETISANYINKQLEVAIMVQNRVAVNTRGDTELIVMKHDQFFITYNDASGNLRIYFDVEFGRDGKAMVPTVKDYLYTTIKELNTN